MELDKDRKTTDCALTTSALLVIHKNKRSRRVGKKMKKQGNALKKCSNEKEIGPEARLFLWVVEDTWVCVYSEGKKSIEENT